MRYFKAALILKQVTGNVRILVVNPKDEEEKRAAAPDQVKSSAEQSPTAKDTFSPVRRAVNATRVISPTKTPAGKDGPDVTSPAKSPTAQPTPAKKVDNTIELKKDANGLGISIVGGSDTPLVSDFQFHCNVFLVLKSCFYQGRVIVHEVYKNGAADKDGRIKPGDFIESVDGKAFKECTHKDALRALRFTKDKVRVL